MLRLAIFLFLALGLMPVWALAQALEAVFVSGSVEWAPATGEMRPLRKGERLPEGVRVRCGNNGHAYFTTADGGFIVLRPNTSLRVVRYMVAGEVAIRLELDEGTTRVITGGAAKSSPARFRLETPLAAIGVRGTDFTTFSDAMVTRVSVRSGAVVVAALGEGCMPGGIGPCEGPGALELRATDTAQVEVRRGMPPQIRQTPEGTTNGTSPNGGEGRPTRGEESIRRDTLSVPVSEVLAGDGVSVSSTRSVYWGRWAKEASRFEAITDRGRRELVAADAWYAVAREPMTVTLPREGRIDLRLEAAAASVVDPLGGRELAPAQVNGGELRLDFTNRRFATRLAVEGGGYRADVAASGNIGEDGRLDSYWLLGGNATVRGALEPGGTGAAYWFRHVINREAEISGVTQWRR